LKKIKEVETFNLQIQIEKSRALLNCKIWMWLLMKNIFHFLFL
jgi:hypothetical protein